MRWLQTREDGYTRRKYYVYECQLDGDWWEMFDGKVWSDGGSSLTHPHGGGCNQGRATLAIPRVSDSFGLAGHARCGA